MTENLEPIPKPTLNRVRVDDPYEVRRWCQRFVCTERQLRDAVAKVGEDPEAVNAELHRSR